MRKLTTVLIFGALLASALLTISSCSKQNISFADLIGSWHEVEPAEVLQFAGSSHDFVFNDNGTFQLTQDLWTDILTGEPCSGNRSDYISGHFSITSKMLSLDGQYSDATFTSVEPNCDGLEVYEEMFEYDYTGEVLLLNPEGELYTQIRLIR